MTATREVTGEKRGPCREWVRWGDQTGWKLCGGGLVWAGWLPRLRRERGTGGGVRSASLSLRSLGPSQPHLGVQAGASQRPCTPVSLGFCRRIHTLRNKTRPGRGARSVPQKKAELWLSVPSSAEGLQLALCG